MIWFMIIFKKKFTRNEKSVTSQNLGVFFFFWSLSKFIAIENSLSQQNSSVA